MQRISFSVFLKKRRLHQTKHFWKVMLSYGWKDKENEPNCGFPTQTFSKWHPDEDRVVEIKQEWNLKFGV